MANRLQKSFTNLLVLIAVVFIPLSMSGCDLGTYNQRFNENRINKQPTAPPAVEDGEGA